MWPAIEPGDHEMYGVLDPDAKNLAAGSRGVGTRVTMKGKKDNVLADLIIGKADKDKPDLRSSQAVAGPGVCVAVKTDKLSTKFGDWIEKDLLKLNAFDVRSVQMDDTRSCRCAAAWASSSGARSSWNTTTPRRPGNWPTWSSTRTASRSKANWATTRSSTPKSSTP